MNQHHDLHAPHLCTGFENPSDMSRRSFLNKLGLGLGGLALADLTNPLGAAELSSAYLSATHFAPKAKRVIFLFQSGAPSQMDLFDHKPRLNREHGKELPDSVRRGQRLTGMSTNQASLPLAGSPFAFKQHGQSGATLSDVLPHTASVADDLCFIKTMFTEAINHGPGVTFMQTGSQVPGRPTIGSWLSYGLGSLNQNLPSFVVLLTKKGGGQPLTSRYWDAGFLPAKHNGVQFRPDKDAVLYLNNPAGVSRANREATIDTLRQLHERQLAQQNDPVIENHIAQYEMAFRMQASVPEATDVSDEPESVLKMYGNDVREPGTYAANCLLARRLAERGVRFIQLYHRDWDAHSHLPNSIRHQARVTDQPSAALIKDLKQRGLLEDTLVVWGGEFGRTNYCQGKMTADDFGRDHHPRCFTMWLAGGGLKHQGHLLCPEDEHKRVPLSNLWLSTLQWFGAERERFGRSTGTFSPMKIG